MGELVLEARGLNGGGREELGEPGEESSEGGGAGNGDDVGLTADVAELVVVGAGEDTTAVAAHEADKRGGRVVGVPPGGRKMVWNMVVLVRHVALCRSWGGGGGTRGG